MRLFIAISLPGVVEEYLKGLHSRIVGAKVSFAHPHLTLKFLGEVSPQKAEQVVQRLAAVRFGSFSASLSRVGFFPSARAARVVWVGVEPAQVKELQGLVDAALVGLFPKENDFVPHLTLARVKEITDVKLFAKVSDVKVEPLSFPVTEFKLVESSLAANGPVYRDVAVFPLQ